MPKHDIYHTRLHQLQRTLIDASVDALLVEDMTDLFYLTGLELSAGKLLVHTHGANLFVDSRYFELCEKNSPFPVLLDPSQLESILSSSSFSFIHRLAFDSEKTSYKRFQQLNKLAKSPTAPLSIIPLEAPLKALRSIKDNSEILALTEAADLGSRGFDFLCTFLKEDITEKEAAIELEIFWKRNGSKSLAFDPIIAFGTNSSMPHYRAGDKKLQRGDIILIDIGVNFKHYHSDMTRIAFFGHPHPQLLTIHSIVQRAQKSALALCQPGTPIGTVDKAVRDLIAAEGYGPNFNHSLGHGVGLDIHEFPTIKNIPPFDSIPLAPGMVITIEPGIYLPNIGGVRIEDTIVITKDGYVNLTNRSTEALIIPC